MNTQRTRHALGPLAMLLAVAACDSGPTEPTVDPQFQSFAGTEWSEPVWLGPLVNSPQRDLGAELSPDGLSLYFNSERDGGLGGMDIWVSRRACEACPFGAPANMGPAINGPGAEGAPSLSTDGHLLFFSGNDRPGGMGGADLYVSWRTDTQDDLSWGPPVNLGPGINTPDHENSPTYHHGEGGGRLYFTVSATGPTGIHVAVVHVSPRGADAPSVTIVQPPVPVSELNHFVASTFDPTLRADGRELIFWSGPQRGGLGGADLWLSTRQSAQGPWSPPTNVGTPVNSAFADLGVALSRDGRTLVFASAEQRGGLGRQDFWMSTRNPSGR